MKEIIFLNRFTISGDRIFFFLFFRKNSPKLEKRKSCPDAYGAMNDSIARSMTMDSLNSYTMPQERVQPLASEDKSLSTSSLEYQNKFLGCLNQDLYRFAK